MHIQHKMSGHRGMFYLPGQDGSRAAELTYTLTEDGTLVLDHTRVNEELRGQNIGFMLVQAAVDHARQYGMKVTPVCTFAKAVFDRKPNFADVLA